MQDNRTSSQRLEVLNQKVAELVHFSLLLDEQKPTQLSRSQQTVNKILQILIHKDKDDYLHEEQVQKLLKPEIFDPLNLNGSIQCLMQPEGCSSKFDLEETIRQQNILIDFADGSIPMPHLPEIEEQHEIQHLIQTSNKETFESLSKKVAQNQHSPESILEQYISQAKQNEIGCNTTQKSERVLRKSTTQIKRQYFLFAERNDTPEIYVDQSQQRQNLYFEDEEDIPIKSKHKVSFSKKKIYNKGKKITKKNNRKRRTKTCNKKSSSYLKNKVKRQVKKLQEDEPYSPGQSRKRIIRERHSKAEKVYQAYRRTYISKPVGRRPQYPEMEQQLSEWIHILLEGNIRLTQRAIRERAKIIMERVYGRNFNFKASKGWAEKFFRRYPSIFALICQKRKSKVEKIEPTTARKRKQEARNFQPIESQEILNLQLAFNKPPKNQKTVKIESE